MELHIGNTARLFAAAEGAREGRGWAGRRGRSEPGPCQSRMKQDHPGWRRELGRGSGRLVGSPCPGPEAGEAAAGAVRPCQSGQRYSAQHHKGHFSLPQHNSGATVIGRVCVCMRVCVHPCRSSAVRGKRREIFLGYVFDIRDLPYEPENVYS